MEKKTEAPPPYEAPQQASNTQEMEFVPTRSSIPVPSPQNFQQNYQMQPSSYPAYPPGAQAVTGIQPVSLENFREQTVPLNTDWVITDGKMETHSAPGCIESVFMLPFPFFCLGCCIFSTSDCEFDDKTRMITFSGYPGHLFCFKTVKKIPYDQVANVCVQKANMRVNNESTYNVFLLTRDGNQYELSGPKFLDESIASAQQVHYFLYGRGNQMYRRPGMLELLL